MQGPFGGSKALQALFEETVRAQRREMVRDQVMSHRKQFISDPERFDYDDAVSLVGAILRDIEKRLLSAGAQVSLVSEAQTALEHTLSPMQLKTVIYNFGSRLPGEGSSSTFWVDIAERKHDTLDATQSTVLYSPTPYETRYILGSSAFGPVPIYRSEGWASRGYLIRITRVTGPTAKELTSLMKEVAEQIRVPLVMSRLEWESAQKEGTLG